jgi:hypothetical protein
MTRNEIQSRGSASCIALTSVIRVTFGIPVNQGIVTYITKT